MVLAISSVVLFSLAERKKNNKKKIKYRFAPQGEKGQTEDEKSDRVIM